MCCPETSHHTCSSPAHRDFAICSLQSFYRSYQHTGDDPESPNRNRRTTASSSSLPDLHHNAYSQSLSYHDHPTPPYALPQGNASTSILSSLQSRLASTLTGVPRRPSKPVIRVYILRQIIVEVRGQKAWRTCVLGEGVMRPTSQLTTERCSEDSLCSSSRSSISSRSSVDHSKEAGPSSRPLDAAPSYSATPFRPSSDSTHPPTHTNTIVDPYGGSLDPTITLDWDGTLRCASPQEVQVGGFAAWPTSSVAGLVVKDFVVVSVVPPDPTRSDLVEHQWAHPVRLVTDPGRGAGGEDLGMVR